MYLLLSVYPASWPPSSFKQLHYIWRMCFMTSPMSPVETRDTYLSQPGTSKTRCTPKWCPCKERLRRQKQKNASPANGGRGDILISNNNGRSPASSIRLGTKGFVPSGVGSLFASLMGLGALGIAPDWMVSKPPVGPPTASVNTWTNQFHPYLFCLNQLKKILKLPIENANCNVYIVL